MTNIITTDAQKVNPRSSLQSLEPAIDPNARPTFLLDWELTLKCNLDCTYCDSGPDGFHWNASPHPAYKDCLETIDFLYEYVDLYMQYKPNWTRAVVLNIYGGESLYYPEIEKVLEQVKLKHEAYKDKWSLKVTCTTNAIVPPAKFKKIAEYIDEFTLSYHSEARSKDHITYQANALYLHSINKPFKCVVLMHDDPEMWKKCIECIEFCKNNNLDYLPRQLDGHQTYNKEMLAWFANLYSDLSGYKNKEQQQRILDDNASFDKQESNLSSVGRACCGGRKMCMNGNLKNPIFYIPDNNYKDWYCSVNWFFVYVRQAERKIYTNKDCKMNFNGSVGPIGTLDNYKDLIEDTKQKLSSNTMPVIQCQKTQCMCGLCAPKASTEENFYTTMKKHITQDVFLK